MNRADSMTVTLRRLTRLSVAVALLAMLSYGLGANLAVRFLDPPVGAWWNSVEFWLMEGAATAAGVLYAIRIVARMLHDSELRPVARNPAFLLAALIIAPLTQLISRAARATPAGFDFSRRQWLIGIFHYDAANMLEKAASAASYVVKTALLGVLCGGAVAALVIAFCVGLRPTEAAAAGESATAYPETRADER